jgi:hypothetical protein
MNTKTKGQKAAADVAAILRSRSALVWVTTREEARAEALLAEAAGAAGYIPHTWDLAAGARNIDGAQTIPQSPNADPEEMLDTIRARSEDGNTRDVWIMRDLPIMLEGQFGARALRRLRNLARSLPATPRDRAQAVIVLTPSAKIPEELAGHAIAVDWPMPDRAEIAAILDRTIEGLPDGLRDQAATNGAREAAIDAAVGLTGEEAAACYARSLVQLRKIDPATVAGEKRRVIARERVLEWFDPIPGGIAAVGGLENLKAWLETRKSAYSAEARAYGLPAPKGVFLGGIPGCGKSLTAKAIASTWGVPLLRLDMGGLKDKFVGGSEGNIRKAFSVIGAIGRCVVWIDEIEKALAGATQGAADGGVSSDALGSLLSWMQERQGEAFVIATANDVESLPPELLRKGRFDEVFWIDLPTAEERAAVLAAALRSHGRDAAAIDLATVAAECTDYTGSEIAALVPDAMFAAFNDGGRAITTADLCRAAKTVTPLSATAADKIGRLRTWAKGKARPASITKEATATKGGRQIDL